MCIEIGKSSYVQLLLKEATQVPVDNEVDTEKIKLPPWFDEKLFKKGQRYFTRNIFGIFVGMLCGLISVLAIPSILKVLVCTQKSSSPATAYRRYIRTIFHVVNWHWFSFSTSNSSITNSSKNNNEEENDFIKKNSKVWKSLMSVRKTHLTSSKFCAAANSGIISQKDMVLTQFGFMGFFTLKAKLLGLEDSEEFLDATVHFWRVIGYMLGIQDEYNLCTDSWLTTKERLEAVLNEIYRPGLSDTNEKFMEMTTALIDGLWSFNPFLSVDTYLFFTKRLAGCNGYDYLKSDCENEIPENTAEKIYKKLRLYNRATLCMLVYTLQYLYRFMIFKAYLNFQIYLSLFLIYYFPFLAFHRFGFKKSYVRIYKN